MKNQPNVNQHAIFARAQTIESVGLITTYSVGLARSSTG